VSEGPVSRRLNVGGHADDMWVHGNGPRATMEEATAPP
jgi:hypothetical protein